MLEPLPHRPPPPRNAPTNPSTVSTQKTSRATKEPARSTPNRPDEPRNDPSPHTHPLPNKKTGRLVLGGGSRELRYHRRERKRHRAEIREGGERQVSEQEGRPVRWGGSMFPFRQPAALAAASFPPCLLRSSARSPPSLSDSLSLLLAHRQRRAFQYAAAFAWLFCWAVGPFPISPPARRLLTNYFISLMTIMNKADGCRVVAC